MNLKSGDRQTHADTQTHTDGHKLTQSYRCFDYSFDPKPKYHERFARQYRHEPPPEIPQNLPFSGTVHRLYALTQNTHNITVDCRCTYPSIHLHCACRLNTRKLAHVLDSRQAQTGADRRRQTQTDPDRQTEERPYKTRQTQDRSKAETRQTGQTRDKRHTTDKRQDTRQTGNEGQGMLTRRQRQRVSRCVARVRVVRVVFRQVRGESNRPHPNGQAPNSLQSDIDTLHPFRDSPVACTTQTPRARRSPKPSVPDSSHS